MPTWQYIGILLLILVLFLSPLWKGMLTRRAQKFGEDAGKNFAAKRLPVALDALSTTLELQTDPATATDVINQAVAAKPKLASAAGPGTWHVAFAERDDVHCRLTEVDGGVRLAVVKSVEFQQFPQGAAYWKKFRERIVKAAQDRGIATREGTSPHLQRITDSSGEATSGGGPACIWVAPSA
ncbi:hypothetical protein GCM10028820_00450 [Tessaracoccus terricola]